MNSSTMHYIHCKAAQSVVYDIIKDSSRWPELFEPCVAVNTLEKTNHYEYIEIQAMVNDSLMTWNSKRIFQDDIYGIDVTVIKPIALLKSMRVNWRVVPVGSEASIIVLSHDYEIADKVIGIVPDVNTQEQALRYMTTAIENNSIKELEHISKIAQKMSVKRAWSTTHSVICECNGAIAYQVLKNIALWPKIIEACTSAEIVNKKDNVEEVFVTAKGENNTLSWITHRVYNDTHHTIVFSLPEPMPLLKVMNGKWYVISLGEGRCIVYVERHFELLNRVRNIIEGVHTLSEAYRFVKKFIADNADKELSMLKQFMESNASAMQKSISS